METAKQLKDWLVDVLITDLDIVREQVTERTKGMYFAYHEVLNLLQEMDKLGCIK